MEDVESVHLNKECQKRGVMGEKEVLGAEREHMLSSSHLFRGEKRTLDACP